MHIFEDLLIPDIQLTEEEEKSLYELREREIARLSRSLPILFERRNRDNKALTRFGDRKRSSYRPTRNR